MCWSPISDASGHIGGSVFIEPQETKLLVHKQNRKKLGKKTLQTHISFVFVFFKWLKSHNLFHVYDERDDVLS